MAKSAPATICLLVTVGLAACGGRANVERSAMVGDDVQGQPVSSSGTSVSLYGSDSEAQLAQAKSMVRAGDFAGAIGVFQTLYKDLGNPDAVRAEALLRWAETEGSLLNPHRDTRGAIARVELFQEQFPKSELKQDAADLLDRLRKQKAAAEDAAGK